MKGNIQDFFIIPVILFAIVMTWQVWFSLVANFVPGIRDAIPGISATSSGILNTTSGLFSTFDNMFLIVAVGMGLAAFISSYFIDSHPAFFFVSIIVFLIAMLVVPILSNIYNDFIESIATTTYDPAQRMPIVTAILQNFSLYMLGIFAMVGIGLYAKFTKSRE